MILCCWLLVIKIIGALVMKNYKNKLYLSQTKMFNYEIFS